MMTLKNKEELLELAKDILSGYLDTRDFGEFGVTVNIDHGRVVKLNRVEPVNEIDCEDDEDDFEK